MFSIIIPAWNKHEYTQACIESIRECSDGAQYDIILVDNGSSPPATFPTYRDDFINLCNKKNLGFPKACNQGLKAAKGETLIILNNDAIVTSDWLNRLKWHLDNGLDVVGPCCNEISGPQRRLVDRYENRDDLFSAAESFYAGNRHMQMPYHRIVGFCLALKREVYEAIGGFNEIFSPGNFEDDDFCMRAIDVGFKCGIALDTFIHHFGSVSFDPQSPEYNKLLLKNKGKFEKLWPQEKYEALVHKNNKPQKAAA